MPSENIPLGKIASYKVFEAHSKVKGCMRNGKPEISIRQYMEEAEE